MGWFYAITFVASLIYMITRKPKVQDAEASGLEDFSFPTAAERPIPVVFGTCLVKGANVLWYGDLSNRPIIEKTKQLFKTIKQTIGHRYYMGIQMGICHGPDAILREIRFGDDVVWSGTSKGDQDYYALGQSDTGKISIDKPEIFGGDEGGGGVSGTARFYNGSLNQRQNSYLAGVRGADRVSPLRSIAHIVLEKIYIGNTPSPKPVSFVISRYSGAPEEFLGSTESPPEGEFTYDQVGPGGLDANPAYVIYEILTSKRFGAAIPKTMIDTESFKAAAFKLYTEQMGISMIIDSPATASDAINNILKIIQASLVKDRATGQLKLKLIRSGYDLDDLFELNERNIKRVSGYSRGSLDAAASEVKVSYTSRDFGYTQRTAIAQNVGVRIHKGDVDSRAFSMPAISRADLATQIAQRELVSLSGQLANCTVECNRSAAGVEVGDVVVMSFAPLKIDRIAMRVIEVGLGEAGSKAVVLKLMQDIFSVSESVYNVGDERVWQKPVVEAMDVENFALIEAPVIFTNNGSTRSILVCAENPGGALDYTIAIKKGMETSYTKYFKNQFTPCLTLAGSLSAGVWKQGSLPLAGDLSIFSSLTNLEVRDAQGILLIDSAAGREWVSYESVGSGMLSEIHRGLFGSMPLAHPAGAKVWAVSEGCGVPDELAFTKDEWLSVKMLVGTQDKRMAEEDATTRSIQIIGANDRPWLPGNFRVNGLDGGQIVGDATLTWATREGSSGKLALYYDETSYETATRYQVRVWHKGEMLVGSGAGVSEYAGTSWTFERERDYNEDAPGQLFSELDFEIRSMKAGFPVSDSIFLHVTR